MSGGGLPWRRQATSRDRQVQMSVIEVRRRNGRTDASIVKNFEAMSSQGALEATRQYQHRLDSRVNDPSFPTLYSRLTRPPERGVFHLYSERPGHVCGNQHRRSGGQGSDGQCSDGQCSDRQCSDRQIAGVDNVANIWSVDFSSPKNSLLMSSETCSEDRLKVKSRRSSLFDSSPRRNNKRRLHSRHRSRSREKTRKGRQVVYNNVIKLYNTPSRQPLEIIDESTTTKVRSRSAAEDEPARPRRDSPAGRESPPFRDSSAGRDSSASPETPLYRRTPAHKTTNSAQSHSAHTNSTHTAACNENPYDEVVPHHRSSPLYFVSPSDVRSPRNHSETPTTSTSSPPEYSPYPSPVEYRTPNGESRSPERETRTRDLRDADGRKKRPFPVEGGSPLYPSPSRPLMDIPPYPPPSNVRPSTSPLTKTQATPPHTISPHTTWPQTTWPQTTWSQTPEQFPSAEDPTSAKASRASPLVAAGASMTDTPQFGGSSPLSRARPAPLSHDRNAMQAIQHYAQQRAMPDLESALANGPNGAGDLNGGGLNGGNLDGGNLNGGNPSGGGLNGVGPAGSVAGVFPGEGRYTAPGETTEGRRFPATVYLPGQHLRSHSGPVRFHPGMGSTAPGLRAAFGMSTVPSVTAYDREQVEEDYPGAILRTYAPPTLTPGPGAPRSTSVFVPSATDTAAMGNHHHGPEGPDQGILRVHPSFGDLPSSDLTPADVVASPEFHPAVGHPVVGQPSVGQTSAGQPSARRSAEKPPAEKQPAGKQPHERQSAPSRSHHVSGSAPSVSTVPASLMASLLSSHANSSNSPAKTSNLRKPPIVRMAASQGPFTQATAEMRNTYSNRHPFESSNSFDSSHPFDCSNVYRIAGNAPVAKTLDTSSRKTDGPFGVSATAAPTIPTAFNSVSSSTFNSSNFSSTDPLTYSKDPNSKLVSTGGPVTTTGGPVTTSSSPAPSDAARSYSHTTPAAMLPESGSQVFRSSDPGMSQIRDPNRSTPFNHKYVDHRYIDHKYDGPKKIDMTTGGDGFLNYRSNQSFVPDPDRSRSVVRSFTPSFVSRSSDAEKLKTTDPNFFADNKMPGEAGQGTELWGDDGMRGHSRSVTLTTPGSIEFGQSNASFPSGSLSSASMTNSSFPGAPYPTGTFPMSSTSLLRAGGEQNHLQNLLGSDDRRAKGEDASSKISQEWRGDQPPKANYHFRAATLAPPTFSFGAAVTGRPQGGSLRSAVTAIPPDLQRFSSGLALGSYPGLKGKDHTGRPDGIGEGVLKSSTEGYRLQPDRLQPGSGSSTLSNPLVPVSSVSASSVAVSSSSATASSTPVISAPVSSVPVSSVSGNSFGAPAREGNHPAPFRSATLPETDHESIFTVPWKPLLVNPLGATDWIKSVKQPNVVKLEGVDIALRERRRQKNESEFYEQTKTTTRHIIRG